MNKSFSNALEEQTVVTKVADVDYHRNFAAFGSVDTHYIIQVRPCTSSSKHSRFATFRIEKSFKDFRTLVTEFKRASNETTDDLRDRGQAGWKNVPESTQTFIAFSDAFAHVIDSSPKTYLAKMSFDHVEKLSRARKDIIEKAIRVILENYPDKNAQKTLPVVLFKKIVSDFFLTDHVYDSDDDESIKYDDYDADMPISNGSAVVMNNDSLIEFPDGKNMNDSRVDATTPVKQIIRDPLQQNYQQPHQEEEQHHVIRPKSLKKRLSQKTRIENENMFMRSKGLHMYDGDDKIHEKKGGLLDDPKTVLLLLVLATHFFLMVPEKIITIQLDTLILFMYSFFVVGLYAAWPAEPEEWVETEPIENEANNRSRLNRSRADSAGLARRVLGDKGENRKIVAKSVGFSLGAGLFNDANPPINGVLKRFPLGAVLGSVSNCWSPSAHADFLVRGSNYLKDKVKIPSGDFIFPPRGVEVFLTDNCPEHIGRYKVMMNQTLREKPSFIVNFRLPWGNCVFTSEIPAKFLPFLTHRYCPSNEASPPSMDGMSPQEICTCRFLMGDNNHKSQTLKIIPSVVKGPWIVKKVVDGKPAIVGSKLPTSYIYEPANPEKGLAEYLEIDLDIVASSAARGILAVAQRYTKTLTLDLGFVVQGNRTDELPEQMLVGMRLHGLDPLTAPNLPEDFNSVHW